LIVAVDDLIADIVADFFEEAEELDLLLETVEEGHVLELGGGKSDGGLLLRRVRYRTDV
jgi:hypothetical protein